jgi:ATP-binding cassette subfamily B protein
MLVLLVFNIVISAFKDVFLARTGQLIDARLILGYYKHLLKLPQQFFDTMRVGEIISRISDAVKIRYFINGVALELVVDVLIILFSFGIMFTYYWKLGIIMMAIIPIYVLIYYIVDRLNRKTERKIMEKSADLESHLVESLNGVSTIKSFGLEDFTNQKIEHSFISLLKTTYKSTLNGIFVGTSSNALTQLFTIILLWVGSYFVIHHEITIGELLSFYAIMGYFTVPIASLVGANKQIQAAWIAADRLFEIMDLEIESSTNKFKISADKIGDIKFNKVAFRYGTRTKVFEDFDLTLKKGKITAIVGESGSGKSTLASLLQNMYPLNGGSISIGDYDLKYLENENLRKMVSVVPQKIDLFGGSVIENIAVGEAHPDIERVIQVCKDIGIKDFIESLHDGFNTYLGEIGITLSGGQKQRIAIARALYKNPEILILDEATSSLDSNAESYIRKSVEQLRASNKTIVLIAHRLSTVVNADEIVVMKNGKVIEQANHQELYAQKGHYYQLWQQQIPDDLKIR